MSVISESVYEEVAGIMESNSLRRQSMQLVSARFPRIPEDTLLNIHAQLVRMHTKRTCGQHHKPNVKLQHYQNYILAKETEKCGSPDLLLLLAEKVSLSPALYARIVLEQYAAQKHGIPPQTTLVTSGTLTPSPSGTKSGTLVASGTPNPSPSGANSSNSVSGTNPSSGTNDGALVSSGTSTPSGTNSGNQVPQLTKAPAGSVSVATPTRVGTTPTSSSASAMVNQWMRNPLTIPDPQLQLHVKNCILKDTNYGPLADNLKRSVGYEYEFLLREKVKELNVPFLDEEDLRARGYDKTPDIKLEVPVAVNGHIVNWIESKASFGDRVSHERYLEDQFWSYQNRYGSGLVIYWFGYVTELNSHGDKGILLMEQFPDSPQITRLGG